LAGDFKMKNATLLRKIRNIRVRPIEQYGYKNGYIPELWQATLGHEFTPPPFHKATGDPFEGTSSNTVLHFLEVLNELRLLKTLFHGIALGGEGRCERESDLFPIAIRKSKLVFYQNLLPWTFAAHDLVLSFAGDILFSLMSTQEKHRLKFACEPFEAFAPHFANDILRKTFSDCFRRLILANGNVLPRGYSDQSRLETIQYLLRDEFLRTHAHFIEDFQVTDLGC